MEETDDDRLERTVNGVLQRVNKRNASLPEFVDYPVKNRRDYANLRERLLPDAAARYPANWDELVAACRPQDDTPLCTHMDGFFGTPREMMGLTTFLTTFYDDPDLIRQIVDERADFYIALYEKAIRDMGVPQARSARAAPRWSRIAPRRA